MTDPLIEALGRFATRARERGIPYNDALIDALDTWLEMDTAEQEWQQTEEAMGQCAVLNIDELPPRIAEYLRAVVDREHEKLLHARDHGAGRQGDEEIR